MFVVGTCYADNDAIVIQKISTGVKLLASSVRWSLWRPYALMLLLMVLLPILNSYGLS